MLLIDNIKADLKTATLAREELRVSVLRMLISAAHYKRVELMRDLTDTDVIGVLQKEIKQRRESVTAYQATRPELAAKEEAELGILSTYLPSQITDEELTSIVKLAVTTIGAKDIKDMGRVIAEVKVKVGTGAEGARVASEVKRQLGL